MEHEIHIVERKQIVVSDVTSVDGFDENCICVNLKEEQLLIYGKSLHIEGLDMEAGVLTAAGQIESLGYAKKKEKRTLRDRICR